MHDTSNSNDSTRIPIGLDEGHHQCTQWDKIDGWMKERSLDVFTPGLIVHPTLGKYYEHPLCHLVSRFLFCPLLFSQVPGEAYPEGKGSDIGVALDVLMSEQDD